MKKLYWLFIVAFSFRMILAFIAWHPDMNNHIDWGIRFWQYGPGEFYQANVWSFGWPNQPPGTILIFAFIRKLYEGIFSFFWWINITVPLFPSNIMLFFEERLYPALLKLPAIIADLGIAYFIIRFFNQFDKKKLGFIAASVFLFNPAIWYNSSVWGQTDATVSVFAFAALILLLERRLNWVFLFLAISIFIKASLLLVIPIVAIVALRQQYSLKQWASALSISVGIIALLTVPFSWGEPFSWLYALYTEKVFGWQLHLITANAFNLWAFIAGIHEQPDTLLIGPWSFNTWGYLLFGIAYLPLLYTVWKSQSPSVVVWVAFLTSFASFVLLTGMHERYLYPVFPFFAILAVQHRGLLLSYGLLSGIYVLNLYNFWWYPRMEWLVELLSAWGRMLPRVFGLLVTGVFVSLYWFFFKISPSLKRL